jgi:hypothetical protein
LGERLRVALGARLDGAALHLNAETPPIFTPPLEYLARSAADAGRMPDGERVRSSHE